MRDKQHSRGESVVVSYILVIGIMTLITVLLITAATGYLETKQNSVTETQAEIATESIAAELEEVDKHARTLEDTSVKSGAITYQSDTDDLIGQYPYTVTLEPHPQDDTYQVVVTVQSNDVNVTERTNVTFYTISNVDTTVSMTGSTLRYTYQKDGTLQLADSTSFWAIDKTSDYDIPKNTTFNGGVRADGAVTGGENATIYGPLRSTSTTLDVQTNLTVFGSVRSASDMSIVGDSYISQNVISNGQANLGDNMTVSGSVTGDTDVSILNNSVISGSVTSNTSNINIGANNSIQGAVNADGQVNIQTNSRISSSITANGNINTESNISITGPVATDSDISIGQDSSVTGSISGARVSIQSDSQVTGNITGTDDVYINPNTIVDGAVESDDAVYVSQYGEVDGTVTGDTVALNSDTIVTSDVFVPSGSDLSCALNVTINGQSCTDYKDANY